MDSPVKCQATGISGPSARRAKGSSCFRDAHQRADGLGPAVGAIELRASPWREPGERPRLGEHRVKPGRDLETAPGEPDRGLEQPRPGDPPVLAMRELGEPEIAGDADA